MPRAHQLIVCVLVPRFPLRVALRGPLPDLALHGAASLLDSIAGASRDNVCGLVHLLCDR